MGRAAILTMWLGLGLSSGGFALTGSGDSATAALETVPPALAGVSAATASSLSVAFSEPMLAPGVTSPGNYTISGLGAGTLNACPSSVTGGGPYALSWAAGEMRDGETVTVTASGLQDVMGNPLDPAGNSASCAGEGVAPAFSNLQVIPAQAAAGDTVTITFTASEPLDGDPIVTVNGRASTRRTEGMAVDYTYQYEVEQTDGLGMAAIAVSGLDLAGNLGALNSNVALEILAETPELPLRAWPAAAVLAALGLLTPLLRRRRAVALLLLLVAALTAAPVVLAQVPVISNVAFTQGPNGTAGTEVVVTYDLVASNGPCAITVSLSKNGGADGFIHPVTRFTGDIAGVTTGMGRHIVWNIAADYPNESIPQARIRIMANDEPVQHTLTYTAGANGAISGASPQVVNHGESGTAVSAVPEPGYHFVQWSDLRTDNPRTDTNITWDVSVVAEFAITQYTLTYAAGANGEISGTSPQTVNHGGSGTAVSAVPEPGYHFVQWSDLRTDNPRTDSNVTADISVAAEFAINQYTLIYTAGANGAISGTSPQTVDHGADGSPVTAVPNTGCHFVQWSDGLLTATRQDTNVTANISVTASFAIDAPPVVTSFAINSGEASTSNLVVTLDNTATNSPDDYMASEASDFSEASWLAYDAAPSFTLSSGLGTRTVYFKVRNTFGESAVVNNTIFLAPQMVSVSAGTFTMGRTATGDDATYGGFDELPEHQVTLSTYQIGKYEVTNQQYCDVLNWAIQPSQDYLLTSAGAVWTGTGAMYAGGTGARYLILSIDSPTCLVQYSGGVFSPKSRTGLPGTTTYSMADHPVEMVSWYGSAAFCNWSSEMEGLTPCYTMNTAFWPLTTAPPTAAGYRLPTEAEWERAAAWDVSLSKHWIYGMMSNTLTGSARCNYRSGSGYVDPLGLTSMPYTSPTGWFNGLTVSPNGGITTVDSPSPVGCCDMSGNVYEWCQDWYSSTYYDGGTMTNPTGPVNGLSRVFRGGCWAVYAQYCRTAYRDSYTPTTTGYILGFRIARS